MRDPVQDVFAVRGARLSQLTPADSPAVLALQDVMLTALPDPLWYVPSTPEEVLEGLESGDAFGFSAKGSLVGYAAFSPWQDRGDKAYAPKVGHAAENTFDVHDVIVHPDYRRRGMHSAFLLLFEEAARAMGGSAIYATVDPGNAPSVGAFEKAGYVHIKTQPAYDGRLRSYYRKDVRGDSGEGPLQGPFTSPAGTYT